MVIQPIKSNDKIDNISSYLGKVNSINSFLVSQNIHDIIISSEIHSNNDSFVLDEWDTFTINQ